MKTVAVYEAKNRFSELLAEVALGEEFTITRHGTAVARLVAMGAPSDTTAGQGERVSDAMHRLRALGSNALLGAGLAEAIGAGRD